MLETQKAVMEIYIKGETSEKQIRDYINLWKPLVDRGYINSVESAVVGTLFGKASLYFRFINYNTELTDEHFDMFNELFTDNVLDKVDFIKIMSVGDANE